jgi:hypothetical protein
VRVWDAVTGELLVGTCRRPAAIRRVFFHADGTQAGLVREDGMVETWSLTPDDRPIEVLVALAQLLSGAFIDEKQERHALDSERLLEAWEKVHSAR